MTHLVDADASRARNANFGKYTLPHFVNEVRRETKALIQVGVRTGRGSDGKRAAKHKPCHMCNTLEVESITTKTMR